MEKILIVDDSDISRDVLTFAFEDRFECVQARNGVEAIECLKKDAYACVLLDIMMPELDGFGVLSYLRERIVDEPAFKMPPVIVLSSSQEEDIREKCLAAGAVESLSKPFKIKAVNEVMERVGVV